DEAHSRGVKFTGHLCSVGYREAVALGIDGLEHGLFANSEYDENKQPDACPSTMSQSLVGLDIEGDPIRATHQEMIDAGVAMTSTLPIYEAGVAGRPPLEDRVLDALSPETREEYLTSRRRLEENPESGRPLDVLLKGMEYEK